MNILYRALNCEEIKAGNILIPKSQAPFLSEQRFPITFPMTFGPSEAHAVRDHQCGFPTRGVSTSLIKDIAVKKYGLEYGVIAVIDRLALGKYGIKEFVVKDNLCENDILYPEDEEVVLVRTYGDGGLPKGIIVEVFNVT